MFQVFQFGPFFFWSRLVCILLGLWLSIEFFLRLAESANLSLQHFKEHGLRYVLACVLGGVLLSVLTEYQVYVTDPLRILILWDGSFSFLGGAIGIGIVIYFATRGHRSIFLQWLDALLPATTLGLVFFWVGAFLSGDAYGKPTDVPWGITYDAINVRYVIPIHPVQAYYALFYFILTFLLLIVRKRSKRVGAETLFGIVCASVGTFALEYFRGDFAIPVSATKVDFILLFTLFATLGLFAAIELKISKRTFYICEGLLVAATVGYMIVRPSLDLETYDLRVSQLMAIMALLATVVYVVIERRKHPYF